MHGHYVSTVEKLSNKLSVEGISKISHFIAEFSQNTVSAVLKRASVGYVSQHLKH